MQQLPSGRTKTLARINSQKLDAAKGRRKRQKMSKRSRAKAAAKARKHQAQKQTAEAAETAAAAQTEQWLTTKETLALAQISRTTLHLKTKAGTFPQAIKIGKKSVWIRSEIDRWITGTTYREIIK